MVKEKWTSEDILRALIENMRFEMTYFARHTEAMTLLPEPDVVAARSLIHEDTYNIIVGARFSDENAKRRVQEVIELFTSKGLPFSWWLSDLDTPSDLSMVLESEGLQKKEENVGMYLELKDFLPSKQPSPLRFHFVASKEDLRIFAAVIVAMGISHEAYEKIYCNLPIEACSIGSPYMMVIAYLGDKPVGTGILVLHAGVAGIYYVTTLPEYRKKGFATAMMEFLLMGAVERGYTLATLQASPEGKSLYARLGFSQNCVFKEYKP